MLHKFLFETRIGDLVLSWFEALTGLAIVDANDLGHQRTTTITDSAPAELAEA